MELFNTQHPMAVLVQMCVLYMQGVPITGLQATYMCLTTRLEWPNLTFTHPISRNNMYRPNNHTTSLKGNQSLHWLNANYEVIDCIRGGILISNQLIRKYRLQCTWNVHGYIAHTYNTVVTTIACYAKVINRMLPHLHSCQVKRGFPFHVPLPHFSQSTWTV